MQGTLVLHAERREELLFTSTCPPQEQMPHVGSKATTLLWSRLHPRQGRGWGAELDAPSAVVPRVPSSSAVPFCGGGGMQPPSPPLPKNPPPELEGHGARGAGHVCTISSGPRVGRVPASQLRSELP